LTEENDKGQNVSERESWTGRNNNIKTPTQHNNNINKKNII